MTAILPTLSEMTFGEPHERFCVIKHEELPEDHKACYRINGMDPDRVWSLVWSFADEAAAEAQLAECVEEARSYQTFKVVDMVHCPMNLTGADRDAVMEKFFAERQSFF